jgi:hypothetical protein
MKLSRTIIIAGLLSAAFTGTARAEDQAAASGAGVDVGFFTDSDDSTNSSITVLTPKLNVGVDLGALVLTLDWGFASFSGSTDSVLGDVDIGTFKIGNPTIGAHYKMDLELLNLRVGALLAIPVAHIPDVDPLSTPEEAEEVVSAALAYRFASAMDGAYNPWLWLPGTMTVAVPARAEIDLPLVRVAGEAAVAAFVHLDDRYDDDLELGLQLAGEAGLNLGLVTPGARLTAFWAITGEDDNAQLAFEPFVHVDFGPVYARARLTLNLDEPNGFAFDDDGIWALHLGGGLAF